jgi:peptide-methionine (R)-S-oxide reductase
MSIKKSADTSYPERTPERLRVDRRKFLAQTSAATALAGLAFWGYRRSEPGEAEAAPPGQPKTVRIVEFSDAGVRQDVVLVPKIVKSEDEWRKQLSPEAFEVTRHAGTETAFTGPYWNLHDKGLFRCICCDTALFTSETKYDSGTGWPSFYAPLAKENIREQTDLSLGEVRTAVSCRRCDAHLGHVFDDGPRPTGLRYCMNSVAMRFVPAVCALAGNGGAGLRRSGPF